MSAVRWTKAMERSALIAHAAELEAMAAAARLRAEVLAAEIATEAADQAAGDAAFKALSADDLAASVRVRGRA